MAKTSSVPARERIDKLLDSGSFVEIGGQVTARATDFNLNEIATPADGVVTGYGVIDGNLVYIFSQDITVLKGAIGEMHAKKIANIYDMALKMGAPVIGMIDCAGIRLQEATDALNAMGTLYYKQTMASGVIPQITAIFGTCGGGLAASAALTDFTFMAEESQLFVNSPNTFDGNDVKKCDTSAPQFQSEKTGIVDAVGTEGEILQQIRQLISLLPNNNEDNDSYGECEDELNRTIPGIASRKDDPAKIIPLIADSGMFFETKKEFARDMVTGFLKLGGMTCGVVANRKTRYDETGNILEEFDGDLSPRGCRKAASFLKYCDAFGIPVITLTNVCGLHATMCAEKSLAQALASMIYEYANATVPKVNVITGKAFGTGYISMNSKAIGADMVYTWPDAEIGMMQSDMAAKLMYPGEDADTIAEKAKEYHELQSSPLSAARRGYVDTIIEPKNTRKYLIGALEMLFTKRESRPRKKHGTI